MGRQEITVETEIKAAPKDVFDVLADPKRLSEWLPNVSAVKPVGTTKGLGSERTITLRVQNMEIHSRQKITAHDPGKHYAWSHIEDKLNGKPFDLLQEIGTDVRLAPKGKGTHVKAMVHFTPVGIKAKLATPLLTSDIKKQMHSAMENLKRLTEK